MCHNLYLWRQTLICSIRRVLLPLLQTVWVQIFKFLWDLAAKILWRHLKATSLKRWFTQHPHLLEPDKHYSRKWFDLANRMTTQTSVWGSSCIQMIDNTITPSPLHQCFSYRNDNTFHIIPYSLNSTQSIVKMMNGLSHYHRYCRYAAFVFILFCPLLTLEKIEPALHD